MAQAMRGPGFLPPSLSALGIDCIPFLPLSLFSPKPPDGVVLTSEVGFLSGLLPFALLTSTAQDYLPKSKQNTALLFSGEASGRQTGLPTGLCEAGQQGRLDLRDSDV